MGDAGFRLSNTIDRLIEEATEERMLAAGSAGGELLSISAMLGTLDNKVPEYIALESFVVGRHRQAL